MAFDGHGDIFIPMDEFIDFLKKYLGADTSHGEFRFGKMRMEGDEITIAWAFSPICAPEAWAKPQGPLRIGTKQF